MVHHRSYKFLLRPTARQEIALRAMVDDHRNLYNAALQERRDAYRHRSRTTISYGAQSAQMKEIRRDDPDGQGRWSASSQQATLRRLDKAFAAFFRRVKAGLKAGYPRFKGAGRFNTVTFRRDGDGCRWDCAPENKATRLYLKGIGNVRVHDHRKIEGRIRTISVTRERGKRWYAILACDEIAPRLLKPSGQAVGIDFGVATFLASSKGERVSNPRFLQRSAEALAAAQRELTRFPKRVRSDQRTRKHRAAQDKVGRLHAKVHRQRRDHHHKVALDLVRRHDGIAHERLNIAAMTRRPRPRPDGAGGHAPNNATAKSHLNRNILDAGWGVFLGILAYKAESAGRELIPVDPRNTSRMCPRKDCGYTSTENRPTREKFICSRCGHSDHADVIGAINVGIRAGLVLPLP